MRQKTGEYQPDHNFPIAMADDRRVKRGGPAAVLGSLESSVFGQENSIEISALRPGWIPWPWTEEPREAAVIAGA